MRSFFGEHKAAGAGRQAQGGGTGTAGMYGHFGK
jgi:hypothetical protein